MIMIILLLTAGVFPEANFFFLPDLLIYASVALTVISLVDYIVKNRKVITMGDM